jgi:hypothetical protein
MKGEDAMRLGMLALLAATLLAPGTAASRVLEVGPGQAFATPSQAAAAARDGDTIRIAPGRYQDCAVWRANDLVIEGAGRDATFISGRVCQDKGLFVIPGRNVTVRNLTLHGARATPNNGAGIRSEGVDLTVEGVRFDDNQNGILAGVVTGSRMLIRDSEFTRNGTCAPDCAHGVYAGHIALLRVERTRFFAQRIGHHVKSRALRTEVLDSEIADGTEGTASYLIDVPNGGELLVRNVTLQKGPMAQNTTAAIMIGAEGANLPTASLVVENNRFAATGAYATAFVENRSRTPATLRGNALTGRVTPLRGPGVVER